MFHWMDKTGTAKPFNWILGAGPKSGEGKGACRT